MIVKKTLILLADSTNKITQICIDGVVPPLFSFHRHHLHGVESHCRNKEVRIPKRVHPVCEVLLGKIFKSRGVYGGILIAVVCYPPVS